MSVEDLPRLQFMCENPEVRVTTDECGRVTAEIFDRLRNKYVALTPEEWVRQNVTGYLIEHCGYSPHRMSNEMSMKLNRTGRRCDTVVFNDYAEPAMVIEFKAPHIELTRKVFDQILRYNTVVGARYLLISNGMRMVGLECDLNDVVQPVRPLSMIPNFDTIKATRPKGGER